MNLFASHFASWKLGIAWLPVLPFDTERRAPVCVKRHVISNVIHSAPARHNMFQCLVNRVVQHQHDPCITCAFQPFFHVPACERYCASDAIQEFLLKTWHWLHLCIEWRYKSFQRILSSSVACVSLLTLRMSRNQWALVINFRIRFPKKIQSKYNAVQ